MERVESVRRTRGRWACVQACLAFNEASLVKPAFELRISSRSSPPPPCIRPDVCSGLLDDETDSPSAE